MDNAPFSCSCGAIKGQVARVTPQGGTHMLCYCASCRAGAAYCEPARDVDAPVDMFHTLPENVTFTSGVENLVPFAFGAGNILRWKASCCDVPIFGTHPNPKMPIASVITARFENPAMIGPVVFRAFIPKEGGKTGHENIPAFLRVLVRALMARVTGRWRKTPFFNVTTLEPIAPITLISKEEKRALLNAGS